MRRLLAAAALTAMVHTAPAVTALPGRSGRLWPALRGQGVGSTVAFTFDDGPDPASTPAFLDLLADLGVRATFFILGAMAERAPRLLRRIRDEGHELAVHGWTHRNHLRLAPWTVCAEYARTVELVHQVAGVRPAWCRPPYGVLSAGTCLAAARLGLRPVLWTAWGRDWEAGATARSVVDTLSQGGLRPGATVLLHDSDCTSAPRAWIAALAALPEAVARCRASGATCTTLSEHLV